MLDEGLLLDALAERAALWPRPGTGTWRQHGTAVRESLQEALLEPAGWVIDAPDDAGLERVTAEVLAAGFGGDGPLG